MPLVINGCIILALHRSLQESQARFDRDLASKTTELAAKESEGKIQVATLQRVIETSKRDNRLLDGKILQLNREVRSHEDTIKVTLRSKYYLCTIHFFNMAVTLLNEFRISE